ncbi:MAG: hypothetical protein NTV95_03150 [Candidatus Saccharibacteria bacterium]|nr:hypothetical protein [Candidatus Saccharibacteria bacterium]
MENTPSPTPTPKTFSDVARPGATAANPSSRPLITTNVPEQKDPMMTAAPVSQSVLNNPVAVVPKPQMIPEINPAADTPDSNPVHKLKHEEGHIGHVGKRPIKKRKIIIGFLIFLSLSIAFYIMFLRSASALWR